MTMKDVIKVNILTLIDYPLFVQQIDSNRFKDRYEFHENSELDIVWDLVVVYEGINNFKKIKFKKNGLIFISGEPPLSRCYPEKFLKQFYHLITQHPDISLKSNELTQSALNWHFGFNFEKKEYERFNFEKIKSLPVPPKNMNISVITSAATCFPGHRKRFLFLKKLIERYGDQIDYFGKGIKPIPDKADALLPYKFHICLENDSIADYWTEKFADPILGYSIPIYYGCTNIDKYFPEDSYYKIDIDRIEDSFRLIDLILENPTKYYNEKLDNLFLSRKKIIDKYNLFPVLEDFITKNGINEEDSIIILHPCSYFFSYYWLNKKLSLKRFLLRNYYSLKISLRL